jgi:hypothetical protein
MDEDLRGFFSGAHLADYGLKSWMSGYLERAQGAADSDYTEAARWDGHSEPPPQTIACKGSRNGASYEMTELPERAYAAVQLERRIRKAFELLKHEEARVLAAFYKPIPPWSPEGLESLGDVRAVVAHMLGADCARAMIAAATGKPGRPGKTDAESSASAHRAQRSDAKAQLTAVVRAAKKAVSDAKGSYATACAIVVRRQRKESAERFVRGIR